MYGIDADKIVRCKHCDAEIVFVLMEKKGGKPRPQMPINIDGMKPMVVMNNARTEGAIRWVGESHYSTCPAGIARRTMKEVQK